MATTPAQQLTHDLNYAMAELYGAHGEVPAGRWLGVLRGLHFAEGGVHIAMRQAVALARADFVPWSAIGDQVGISAQGAQQRWRGIPEL